MTGPHLGLRFASAEDAAVRWVSTLFLGELSVRLIRF